MEGATSDKTTVSKTGGIGLGSLLTVLFVGLKLTHYIDWSWWWVLAPLWVPTAACLAALVLIALALGVIAIIEDRPKKPAAGRR